MPSSEPEHTITHDMKKETILNQLHQLHSFATSLDGAYTQPHNALLEENINTLRKAYGVAFNACSDVLTLMGVNVEEMDFDKETPVINQQAVQLSQLNSFYPDDTDYHLDTL